MARVDRLGHAREGPAARAFPAREAGRLHPALRRLSAVQAEHGLPQHHREGAGAGISGRSRARAAQRGVHPLERGRRWSCRRTARTPNTAATSRPTPRRRRCTRSASIISGARRATEHPGDMVFIQGHSSPGIYARAYLEGRLTEEQLLRFRQRGRRRRAVFVPASVADAGFLAVPDGVDGPRADDGDFPGALHPLPGAPRHGAGRPTARSGRSSATARWTSPNRWAR